MKRGLYQILLPAILSFMFMAVETAMAAVTTDCSCEGIQFGAEDLKSRSIKSLKTCEEKLYRLKKEAEERAKNKAEGAGDKVEDGNLGVCNAEYGLITTELKRKKEEKASAIDKALSFKPNAFDFHFSAGYEFTSVNTLWSKGNPRVSLGMYRTFPWAHLASQIMLTDAGEQQPVTVGVGGKIDAVRALDFETMLFIPLWGWFKGDVDFYGKDRDYYWGPVALWGAKKLDANNLVLTRHYFGLRGAVGPQSYTDVLVGRAENVSGTRLLIRGQMPFNFPGTDQIIFLGLEGNLAIKDRKNNPSPETVRGYLVWDIDNLLNAFGNGKE